MSDLRPCIIIKKDSVWEPSETEFIEQKQKTKALFHGWIKKRVPAYKNDPMQNFLLREMIGIDERMIAVVEYEDGTMHEHFMDEIQFVDGEIRHYMFPDM